MRGILGIVCLTGFACNGSPKPAEPVKVTKIVSTQGGEISLNGASMTVPAGALLLPVEITITEQAGDPPAGHTVASSVFVFEPIDLFFEVPVRITLPRIPGDDIAVYWQEPLGRDFLIVESEPSSDTEVTALVGHLSRGFSGEGNPCKGDLVSDLENCGSCGRSCNNNSHVNSCRVGKCELECEVDTADCDDIFANACEADLRSIEHCGACGNQCQEGASCVEGEGGWQCACPAGFEDLGQGCQDMDECAQNAEVCGENANCVNSIGSYDCECETGYSGDGQTCEDIDECQSASTCHEQATCTNTPGAFACECNPGFVGDGQSCLDIDECESETHDCSPMGGVCSNQYGSYDCSCEDGYDGTGRNCSDRDECELDTDNCSENASCANQVGGFSCACLDGFSGDGVTCEDVDECLQGTDSCDDNGTCSNTVGSYSCACQEGYAGDGTVCEDVDECLDSNSCGDNATCENSEGGYSCACQSGYAGDGVTCEDVDECLETDICGNPGQCTNTPGSYTCSCPDGFDMVNGACVDIDECLTESESCSEDGYCENLAGGFACRCNSGFVGDGITCNDAANVAIAVQAGGAHTCALMDSHQVRCWGWGIYGELGQGDTEDIGVDNEPAEAPYVQLGQPVRELSLGATHSCAILEDQTVRCWGRNFYGSLGIGNTDDIGDTELPMSAPVSLSGMPVQQVAAGGEHTCALDVVGRVYCWGLGIDGQLGYGNTDAIGDNEAALSPGFVNLSGLATQVVAGRDHSCALLENGTVQCWGRGTYSPTGYGHTDNIGDDELPSSVGMVDVGGTVTQLTAGWYHTCAVLDTGAVRCWGYGNLGTLGYGNRNTIGDDELPSSAGDIDVGGAVQQVVAGTYHTCALLNNGRVRCWGSGADGQLGYGNTKTIGDNESPFVAGDVEVGGLVTQLTAGSFHTCALLDTGAVRCWGSREHGQVCYQGIENIGDDELPSSMGDCPILSGICVAGMHLDEDGITCVDDDECDLGSDLCDSQATCSNTEGSYECTCNAGFVGDGFSCVDADECTEQTDTCDDNATCSNTVGSFTCACLPGYFGDGATCVGACTAQADECDDNAVCTEEGANYSCSCNAGFVGDGFQCVDIDECGNQQDDCDVNAQCENTPGGYLCTCNESFSGDGVTCGCDSGYREDGGHCVDINECSTNADDCELEELCTNTDGSFECIGLDPDVPPEEQDPLACPDGYELTGNAVPTAWAQSASAWSGGTKTPTLQDRDGSGYIPGGQDNDSIEKAQEVAGPATIIGYVNQPGAGGSTSTLALGDTWDIYRMSLAGGQTVSLSIQSDGRTNDLDLYLYYLDGSQVLNANGQPIESASTNRTEAVSAASAGEYLVAVHASAGASSYVLSVAPAGPLSFRGASNAAPVQQFIPDEVIVQFDPAALGAMGNVSAMANTMGMQHARGQGDRPLLLRTTANSLPLQHSDMLSGLSIPSGAAQVAKSLGRRPDVLSASPNYLYQPTSIPNDEYFDNQWHYQRIRAPQAWDVVPDSSAVIVAVIDTGVYLAHPDLDDTLVTGYDFISDPSRSSDGDGIDPDPNDTGDAPGGGSSFHGTHVAGTIAAETNNSIGIAGVAPGAKIMPIRVLGPGGGSFYDIMQGVRYAAGISNDSGTVPSVRADIINMSLGGSGNSPAFESLIAQVRARGVVVVAAAGNDSSSQAFYPAAHTGVLSVSATDYHDNLSYFSNFGTTIDIAAPGGSSQVDGDGDGSGDMILSTHANDNGPVQSTYNYLQGTSMASPHVAGVIALMKAANGNLTPEDIDNILVSGLMTTDKGAAGRDNQYGYGLVDAAAAVLAAVDWETGTPIQYPPNLVAEPSVLYFTDQLVAEGEITLRNDGDGELTIDVPTSDQAWLQVGALAVSGELQMVAITVDREGLEVGSYNGTITITSSANTVVVPVEMLVKAKECLDIDECALNIDNCAAPEDNGNCSNIPGGYECYCSDGYAGDGTSCTEIDECAEETDDCSEFAQCTNTTPGFTCECLDGYTGDGITCLPPDECELGTDSCDDNATCSDTQEGYDCQCDAGFVGDGFTCTDVDECAEGTHDCDDNAVCNNSEGSFSCACAPHSSGDGTSCVVDTGCLSLDNFEELWPSSDWVHPLGEDLTGQLSTLATRTGQTGLWMLDNRGRNTAVRNGTAGDGAGVWVRLDDVGARADLTFGGDDVGQFALRVDGSGSLGLQRQFRHGGTVPISEQIVAVPLEQWMYLDLQFDGGSVVTVSLFSEDGVSVIAGFSADVGEAPIGYLGLAATAPAALDGMMACAYVDGDGGGDGGGGDGGGGEEGPVLVDECALGTDECDDNAQCLDLMAGYQCSCDDGFVGDGFTCADENECSTGNNSCSANATCSDVVGGYECSCADGFVGDGFVCEDVDECAQGNNDCDANATCANSEGSYSCSCIDGYTGDGTSCEDVDECALGVDSCADNGVCSNVSGGYECSCAEGYSGDGFVCEDVDECALGLDSCHDAADCSNTLGSYTCECLGGWTGDGFVCSDIDECEQNTDNCDSLATCSNQEGTFSCTCPSGYTGDGVTCLDIDECSSGTHDCAVNAECSNTVGDYTCTCSEGFSGDGMSCEDIDECGLGTDNCHDNGICSNTSGGFSCECATGYQGDGVTCVDVDECQNEVDACSPMATCSNTVGSFACDCVSGYTGDGFTCSDIDECESGAAQCNGNTVCSNTPGSYSCECQRGYEATGDVCVDIATEVQTVSVGDIHTCALMNEGVVKCWGSGLSGRTGHGNEENIGDNETAGAGTILQISPLAVTQLAVGGAHSCALLEDGSVRCWGVGADGRLGQLDDLDVGDDEHPKDVAVVPMPDQVVQLSLGQRHTCALRVGGQVSCWGNNSYGQLGTGPVAATVRRNDDVQLGDTAISIAAGDFHTCALLDSGDVVCWGLGSFGRLGYGNQDAVGIANTPEDAGPVSLGAIAVGLSAGVNHSCALLIDDTVRCWGKSLYGVLGTGVAGNIGDDEVPSDISPIDLLGTPDSVSAGGSHTCVSTTDGKVQCFGRASDGQLGYGNSTDIGDNELPSAAGYVDVGGTVIQIEAGALHTCAVLDSNAVRCWGNGSLGRLGYGNTTTIGDTEDPKSVGDVPLQSVP